MEFEPSPAVDAKYYEGTTRPRELRVLPQGIWVPTPDFVLPYLRQATNYMETRLQGAF